MKRTVEVVLAIIGAIVYLFGVLFGAIFRMMEGQEGWMQEMLAENPNFNQGDIANIEMQLSNGIGTMGTVLIVGSLISIIAGIVAMFFFRGNSKPKAASIILLVVGAGTTLITFGGAIFAGIFYVIAGIMGLVRKPKQDVMTQY
ncbi:DUF4064 domain-containing protein [Gracilibacillus caseinilyticus]|uniref:DUF4064 domain-containing protein n=1 Tax=Gracilibacillus caseinilyticus TaxID=2932256 RepID=A0ABY4EXN4_9BACI|nr:DUF4064 domain-containing protein [Gracilibacillus caseinilyticus]UOQ49177.1 DUF4064 domain-containing protein [Gracilibacillus caseinilyticus]